MRPRSEMTVTLEFQRLSRQRYVQIDGVQTAVLQGEEAGNICGA
jgi:hypothetical protein